MSKFRKKIILKNRTWRLLLIYK